MKTQSPEMAYKRERLAFTPRGIWRDMAGELEFKDGDPWRKQATVDVLDIPSGTPLNAIARALVAVGVERFRQGQRITYADLIATP